MLLVLLPACDSDATLRTSGGAGAGDDTAAEGREGNGDSEDSGGEDSGGGADSGGEADSGGGDPGGEDGPLAPALAAGFRASPYGVTPAPAASYWGEVAEGMAGRFVGATPAGVSIVGVAGDDGVCYLSFPSPGGNWDDIAFTGDDENEEALDWFDRNGVKVWLQVEPADADVDDLVELVMDQYAHHESVVGFGIDVEWFKFHDYPDGKAVTDEKAAQWRDEVQAWNPGYSLFLKHWLADRMPPTERDGLLFVDDGQGVGSLGALVASFDDWGRAFAPAPVAFQFGYASDRGWWKDLDDPPAEIGQALLDEIPNTTGLLWVDFTVEEVFPP